MQKLIDANYNEYSIGARVRTTVKGWMPWAQNKPGTVSKIEPFRHQPFRHRGKTIIEVSITLDAPATAGEYTHFKLTGMPDEFEVIKP